MSVGSIMAPLCLFLTLWCHQLETTLNTKSYKYFQTSRWFPIYSCNISNRMTPHKFISSSSIFHEELLVENYYVTIINYTLNGNLLSISKSIASAGWKYVLTNIFICTFLFFPYWKKSLSRQNRHKLSHLVYHIYLVRCLMQLCNCYNTIFICRCFHPAVILLL